MRASPQESSLLQAAASFYKTFSIECARTQVTVDMFLFSPSYTDVSSLRGCQRAQGFFSALTKKHFPQAASRGIPVARSTTTPEDVIKFGTELGTVLSSQICLEAVIRVRATRGRCRGVAVVRI